MPKRKLTFSDSGAWETTYIACNRGMLTIEDREEICKGICSVVASFPGNQREKPYHAFALPVVECLHAMTKEADSVKNSPDGNIAAIIPRLADEVRLLSTMVKSFTAVVHKNSKQMHTDQNGSDLSALQPSVGLLKKLWPCLTHIATNYTAGRVSRASFILLLTCGSAQLFLLFSDYFRVIGLPPSQLLTAATG
jgi:hypothetical protein